MMKPMTTGQKIIAYASLVFVLASTVLGLFIVWLIVTGQL